MNAETRKKLVMDYYENYAETYGEEYETTIAGRYFLKRKLNLALKMGGFKKNDHILDAGCANAPFSLALAQRGFKVTGIDLAQNNIVVCRRRAKQLGLAGADFCVADLENLKDFRESQFDGVLSFAALRYVPDLNGALRELYRVTKKGGRVVVDFPNKHSPWFLFCQRFARRYVLPHDKECDLYYARKDSIELMRSVGFRDVEAKVDLFIARTTPNYLAPPFIVLDQLLSHMPLVQKMGGAILLKGMK